jgi:hypothetical protein
MYEYLPPNYRASYGTASFGLQKKNWIKYMRYKKFVRQWKHKLNVAGQIFVARQLAQSDI